MRLISIPANPVPDDVVVGTIKTADGVALRFARWAPPPGRKGTVCLFQGRTEFIEKYFEVVRDLRTRGFAVATIDWRGQGLSQRLVRDLRKGHVGNFSEYVIDLEAFMKEVVLPDCPPPYFALAHSMGAAVLVHSAMRGHRWFDRVVMTAPMIRLKREPLFGMARGASTLLRLAGFGRTYVPGGVGIPLATMPFLGNIVTSDPVRHARSAAVLEVEPTLAVGAPTVSWVNAAYRAMAPFSDATFPSRIRQPILITAAGRDHLVSTSAIEEFAIHLRAGSHLIIPGSLHEILMEQDQYRRQFWAAFDAFVPGTPLFG